MPSDVVQTVPDDDQPATKGELREVKADVSELKADVSVLKADMSEMKRILLEIQSERSGVQRVGPVIPAGTVVVENNRFFAHVSAAFLRHKGVCVKKVVTRFRVAKKYV